MAGDWIKMRCNLWDDPRVSGLADATGSGEAAIIGGLYWLWATADQHTEDGFLQGLTVKAINRKTGIKGFGEALIAFGWLEEEDGGLVIPRFEEHNGTSAKNRAQTARRVAKCATKANDKLTVAALVNDKPANGDSVSTALPREEKRREEVNLNLSDATHPHPTPSGEAQPAQGDEKPDRLPCPVEQIVGLYHEHMPRNPRCKVLNPARRKAIATRWREASALDAFPFAGGYATRDEGIEKWREFFAICADSDFLTGKAYTPPGRTPFLADIDFLFSPSGFAKTLENKYHREAA